MKNLVYFLLCNVIIVALVLFTSCGRVENESPLPVSPAKELTREGQCVNKCFDQIATSASQRNLLSDKDTGRVRSRLSEKAQKSLILWSTSGGL